jgi:hypothetical protein
MDALLVDQVTALYVVLAVALVVFGGVFAYLWRLSAQTHRRAGEYAAGGLLLVAIVLGFGSLAATRAITSVDVALWLVMACLLGVWLGLFYCVWRLDRVVTRR